MDFMDNKANIQARSSHAIVMLMELRTNHPVEVYLPALINREVSDTRCIDSCSPVPTEQQVSPVVQGGKHLMCCP
jgi:hypothetical protein